MTTLEIKKYVQELRDKADLFEQSGCAVDGIVKDFRKSADIMETMIEGTVKDL